MFAIEPTACTSLALRETWHLAAYHNNPSIQSSLNRSWRRPIDLLPCHCRDRVRRVPGAPSRPIPRGRCMVWKRVSREKNPPCKTLHPVRS